MELNVLIASFQNKDGKAFEALYSMYSESMHGVIFNIVRDHDIAQEVLQDVFLKAWHNADTYSSKKGRFFTWLLNIARNAAIDKVRSKDFKNSKKNLDSNFFVDILENEDNYNRATDSIGVKSFVSKLATKCTEIIDLLYFKGFTQKEASESLNLPVGTVKTRNRNCINELRHMLRVQ
jgi:RNA polymerase sigma factor (sigma-70 family)